MASYKYHGYELSRTQEGTWRDLQGQHYAIQVFKTEVRTPYDLGMDRDRLQTKVIQDLREVLPLDHGVFDRAGIDRRAYDPIRPYLIGIQPTKDWKADRWNITLITRDDFDGFR